MANEGTKAVYKNPKILIAKGRVGTLADLDPLFRRLSGAGTNELVILCEDMDAAVVSALAYTHQAGIFKTLLIKPPVLWRDWIFEDFAAMTGATIVEPLTGVTWKTVGLEHLGTCEKLITTREETTVIGIKDLTEHIKRLKESDDEQMKLRVAWLSTKAAVLRVGAESESELSYRRLKAEDAVSAAHLALRDGIVPGGGVALWVASSDLPDTEGGRVLKEAMRAPLKQIILNDGGVFDPSIVWGFNAKGYDSKNHEVTDMWKACIVDPVAVVRNSLKTAISVAGIVLTTETVTTNEEEKK
jgi:chaperonin GroEL